ncbi:carbohydrate kinase [Antarcticibacterium sp. 1MA-6-2]|uniref:carbohydrate kinase family protein n=1 Tax=Antarcticibacterium sp. 1MA-6-2 TaxID=2908210 RepID=UPI001F3F119C|nr:carbohydrate kinase [Antarcticibacterium sp. 1MA-6-2]UJH92853.1 carbohydrate kinase [Antarcticibacterium sp. 1MA-6-2]
MEIKAVCFGEVLWDIFPDEERIGGAPLNVASRLSSWGINAEMISSIGNDKKGEEILAYLKGQKVFVQNITTDPEYPTGKVQVTLSKSGSATYEIAYPSAWDKIKLTDGMLKSVEHANAFIFGSLVCRDEVSRDTLYTLLDSATYKVLDINLRPPHYELDVLNNLMQKADFIKFNDEELFEIAEKLGSPYNSMEQNLEFISEKTNTPSICITKGSHGAVLLTEGTLYYNSGYKVKVKDTVGAGDSFLATLVAKLLQKENPQKAIDTACAVGALVASHKGANPNLTEEQIKSFMFPLEGS